MSTATIDFSYPMPPLDAVMPAGAQSAILIIFGVLAVAFLLYALHLSRKWNCWLPVLFWVGGLCCVLVEAVADLNLHAIHPPVGQLNAYTVHSHPIPWHIVLAYPSYYAGTLIALWPVIAKRTLTRSLAWKAFWIGAIWVTVIEQIPIAIGLWVYYGPHAFKIGYMPVSMIVPNAASVVMVLLLAYKLAPSIRGGWKQLLAIPALPIFALGSHAGTAALMYNVMGMNLDRLGPAFLNAASAVSIAIGLVAVWITIELTQDKSDTSSPIATQARRA